MEKLFFLTLLYGIMLQSALTQNFPDGSPDRPGQIETAETIGRNNLQFETLFFYEKFFSNSSSHLKNFSLPQMLVRFGINDNIEIRAEIDYTNAIEKSESNSLKHTGFKPVSLGVKYSFIRNKKFIDNSSVILKFDLPGTGNNLYCSDYINPELILLTGKTLLNKFQVDANFGVIWCAGENNTTEEFAFSVSLLPINNFSFFAETYGLIYKLESPDIRMDYGVSYSINDNLQLNLTNGFGFSNKSPDYSLNIGFIFKMPKL